MAQIVDGVVVAGYETADAGERLGEGAHDEVYLVSQAEVVAHATALLAEHSETMCLVHHYRAVVLVLQLHYLGQVGEIALH